MQDITKLLKKNGSLNYRAMTSAVIADIQMRTPFLHLSASNAERVYCLLHGISELKKCHCGNPLRFINLKKGYTQFCSKSCGISFMHAHRTPEEKARIQRKVQDTVLGRFGVMCVFQAEEIKEKIYTPENNKNRTAAIQRAVKEKYGCDNVFQIDDVKDKIRERNIQSHGVPFKEQRHIPKEFFDDSILKKMHHDQMMSCSAIAMHFNIDVTTIIDHLRKRGIEQRFYGRSVLEIEMKEFLHSLGVDFIENDRVVLGGKEIDFFIPSARIGIEMNGVYWHSSKFKTKKYHQEKANLADENGVRLFQIFEDEWLKQKDKCKASIVHALGLSAKGIFARKATIREIDWQTARAFLNRYHLQNSGTSGNYRIGAFHDDELIAVMVFGFHSNEMKNKEHIIEMKRFVTDSRNHPGLGSRMFMHAIKEKDYREVIAFVDRRWFTGNFKFHAGFSVVSKTEPTQHYVLGSGDSIRRFHRQFISKKALINDGHDEKLSKDDILQSKGYLIIWDAGKMKLRWVR